MPDRRDKGKSFIFFLNIVLIIPLSFFNWLVGFGVLDFCKFIY